MQFFDKGEFVEKKKQTGDWPWEKEIRLEILMQKSRIDGYNDGFLNGEREGYERGYQYGFAERSLGKRGNNSDKNDGDDDDITSVDYDAGDSDTIGVFSESCKGVDDSGSSSSVESDN